uniref:RRM domain-containing protein n=1 Tax=Trichuris muris TaxID=70415 RepID=A0A5S6QK13_TRIMR
MSSDERFWPADNMETPAKRERLSSVGGQLSQPAVLFEAEDPAGSVDRGKTGSRCRLFIGNLPIDVKEDELRELFSKFGEVSECYASRKGFAFIRLDTRAKAEAAKHQLDGYCFRGRPMRIRYAANQAAVRVKELSPYVSNELLSQAFSVFGDVVRAVHIVDDRGRPTGEGIVEFERKPGAQEALKRISRDVLLLCGNGRPVTCEPYEPRDEEDGLWERMIVRNAAYGRERQVFPHFAPPGSFEYDFGNRWKQLYEVERQKREQLEKELSEARISLENEMELAREEYRTIMLREDLRRRQEELERLEAARRERFGAMQQRNDSRSDRVSSDQKNHNLPPPGAFMHPAGDGPLHRMPHGGPFPRVPNGSLPPPGRGGPRRDENLVHGMQKLLEMFRAPSPGNPAIMFPQPLFTRFHSFDGPPSGGQL